MKLIAAGGSGYCATINCSHMPRGGYLFVEIIRPLINAALAATY